MVYSRRKPILLALVLLLGCGMIAATAWSVSSSSALTIVSSLNSALTPTHAQFHAYAEIIKPTYTLAPTLIPPSPTSVPSESPTKADEFVALAEVIQDTATPQYAVSVVENALEQSEPNAVSYAGNKYILVDISEEHMYVYDGETLAFSFVASTGMNNATRTGSFSVLNKIPNAYGETWNIWMPNWLGIYWAGSLQNGIHALPILPNGAQLWAGYLGTPISYGCVVIGAYEAQMLYDWAEIGTPVEIQW